MSTFNDWLHEGKHARLRSLARSSGHSASIKIIDCELATIAHDAT